MTNRRAERQHGAGSAVNERGVDIPVAQQLCHPIHCIPFADAAEIDVQGACLNLDGAYGFIELQEMESGPLARKLQFIRTGDAWRFIRTEPAFQQRPNRDVKRTGGFFVQSVAELQALEGCESNRQCLVWLELVESGDVAVGDESAEVLFEPVEFRKRFVGCLSGVNRIVMHDEDFINRCHGAVGESMRAGKGFDGVKAT